MGHAKAASMLGDEKPRTQGRLSFTWEGIKTHIDRNGTIPLPAGDAAAGHDALGYAKPVEPNDRHSRSAMAVIGVAGPLVNLALLGAGLGLAYGLAAAGAPAVLLGATKLFIVSNAVLAIFNLIPVFPLDGHWILRAAMPKSWAEKWDDFNANSHLAPAEPKDWLRKTLPYWPLVAILFGRQFHGPLPRPSCWLHPHPARRGGRSRRRLAGAALPAVAAARPS